MKATAAELARHIDQPTDPARRHRLVLLDPRRLRCLDCTQTVHLPDTIGSTSTSSSPIPGPGEPRCRQHQTEHASSCRWCAADLKAATDLDPGGRHILDRQPTADVTARAAEARAQLPPRRDITHVVPDVDPDRMAKARAEVAARTPIPIPEPAEPTTP